MLTLSQCKGFTRISEDSSEIVFLLVENYQLTAPFGASRMGIFGTQQQQHSCHYSFFIDALARWLEVEEELRWLVVSEEDMTARARSDYGGTF